MKKRKRSKILTFLIASILLVTQVVTPISASSGVTAPSGSEESADIPDSDLDVQDETNEKLQDENEVTFPQEEANGDEPESESEPDTAPAAEAAPEASDNAADQTDKSDETESRSEPVTAELYANGFYDEFPVTTEAELVAAFHQIESGSTVMIALQNDITVTSSITLQGLENATIYLVGQGSKEQRINVQNDYFLKIQSGSNINFGIAYVTIAGDSSSNKSGGFYIADSDAYICDLEAVEGEESTTSICNMTGMEYAAGIYLTSSTLVLEGISFSNNEATTDGSAIRSRSSVLTVTDCSFTGNKITNRENATDSDGGTVSARGGGSLTISGSTFTDNNAARGGAIRISNSDQDLRVQVKNSVIKGNTATRSGGGISIITSGAYSYSIAIQDTEISSNKSSESSGGGIYLQTEVGVSEITMSLSDVTLTGNEAASNGGGIGLNTISLWPQLTLSGVTFADNSAKNYKDVTTASQQKQEAENLSSGSVLSKTAVNGTELAFVYNNYDIYNNSSVRNVTYDANGGSNAPKDQRNYASGALLTEPEIIPVRSGYAFTGWTLKGGAGALWDYNSNTITSDITLQAVWEKSSYTVTFDENYHGGGSSSAEALTGSKVTPPDDPSGYFGYDFDGWYVDQEGTTAYDFNTPVEQNLTLYAKWKEGTFIVTDEDTLRQALSSMRNLIDIEIHADTIKLTNALTVTKTGTMASGDVTINIRPGAGYGDEDGRVHITQTANNRHFKASYDPNDYILYLNLDHIVADSESGYGGFEITDSTEFYLDGGKNSAITGISKNQYGNGMRISKDAKVYVSNITIAANHSTVTNAIGGGVLVEAADAEFTNVTFRNNSVPSGSTTYYKDGGGIMVQDIVSSSSYVRASEVLFDNCVIEGNEAGTAGGLSIRNTTSNTAKGGTVTIQNSTFRNNTASVGAGGAIGYWDGAFELVITDTHFEGNSAKSGGGAIGFTDTVFNTYIRAKNRFTMSGLTFENNRADSYVSVIPEEALTELDAIFGAPASASIASAADAETAYNNYDIVYPWNSYQLTYDNNGGSGSASDPNRYGTFLTAAGVTVSAKATVIDAALRMDNHTFTSTWDTNKDLLATTEKSGTYAARDTISVSADRTLYAVYLPDHATVTFDANGGTFADGTKTTATAYYGRALQQPGDPTSTGMYFRGWYESKNANVNTATPYDFSKPVSDPEAITLYAIWTSTAAGYGSVTFYHGDGTHETVVAAVGTTGLEATEGHLAKDNDNYSFAGWYTENPAAYAGANGYFDLNDATAASLWNSLDTEWGAQWDGQLKDGEVLIRYAKYDYKVTASVDRGTVTLKNKAITVASGSSVAFGTELTGSIDLPEGYQLDQWYLNGNPVTADSDGSITFAVTGPVTVTADTSKISYDVLLDYNMNDNEAPVVVPVEHGDTLAKPDAPTREGYTFLGWFDEAGNEYDFSKTVTASFTLLAKWELNRYTVTYDADGGKFSDGNTKITETVDHGDTAPVPSEVPVKADYEFAGWMNESGGSALFNFYAEIEHNTTIYAGWDEVTAAAPDLSELGLTVQDVSGKGEDGKVRIYDTAELEVTTEATAPDGGKLSYQWIRTNEAGTASYAQYAEGKTAADSFAAAGIYYFKVKVTNTYENSTTGNPSTATAYSDVVAVEVYVPEYKVLLVLDQDANLTDATTASYYGKIAEPNQPDKTGYTFDGWYVLSNGTEDDWDFEQHVVTDAYLDKDGCITLYARWQINEYKITFDSNGGSSVDDQTVTYQKTVTKPEEPTRFGYEFTGWYTDAAGTKAYNFSTKVTGGMTLYAGWKESSTFRVYNEATLREALQMKRTDMDILISANKINLTQPLIASQPDTLASGTVNIKLSPDTENGYKDVSIVQTAANARHLVAAYDNTNYEVALTLDHITLSAGTAGSGGILVRNGARLSVDGSNTSTMTGLNAADGGAVLVEDGSALTMQNITLTENHATGNGGAIYVGGASTAIFNNVVLLDNTAGSNGGGAAVRGESKATYTGGSITGNSARIGGGISITKDSLTGSKISGTTFANNAGDYYVSVLGDADKAIYNAGVTQVTSWTKNGTIDAGSAYNNYDIGYPESHYTITYEANGGTGSITDANLYGPDAKATVLSEKALTAPTYYYFSGWNTKADGNGTSYQSGAAIAVTADITLYAQWDRKERIVTFDATTNGYFGTPETQTLTYTVANGETIESPDDPVAVTGSALPYFNGWWKDQDGKKFDFSKPITADMTLTAGWAGAEEGSIAVQLHSHGGTTQGVVYVKDGATLSSAKDSDGNAYEDPSRTGYTFGGWYTDDKYSSNKITRDTQITDSMAANQYLELHAKWNSVTYTATVTATAGGSVTVAGAEKKDGNGNTYTYTYEDEVTLTANAATGYTFSHWEITMGDTSYTIQNSAPSYTHLSADATVHAVFVKNIYTVTFFDEDGEQISSTTVTHGETIDADAYPQPGNTAREFVKWVNGGTDWSKDTNIVSDLSLTAVMKARTYTVTFDPNGGTLSGAKTIKADYGTTVAKPSDPSRDGYTFRGWSVSKDYYSAWDFTHGQVQGDLTLYAYWDEITAAAVERDAITVSVDNKRARIYDEFTLTAKAASPDGGSLSYHWEQTDATGTYTYDEFNSGATQTLAYGTADTYYFRVLVTNTYTNKVTGKTTRASAYSEVMAVTVYVPQYTVRFDTGGTNMQTIKADYLGKIKQPDDPVRTGYNFGGWYVVVDGKEQAWNFDADVVSDSYIDDDGGITLTAKWEKDTYEILFETGGGSYIEAQTIAYLDKVKEPEEAPVRMGYEFTGWYTDAAGENAYNFNRSVTGGMTLYAGWEETDIFRVVDEATLRQALQMKRENLDIRISADEIRLTQPIVASQPDTLAAGTVNITLSPDTENGFEDVTIVQTAANARHFIAAYDSTNYEIVLTLNHITLGAGANGGGGILVENGARLTVNGNDAALTGLSAINGGAVYVDDGSTLTMQNLTLDNNHASNYGGAIYVGGASTAAFENVTLEGNSAGANGGGAAVRGESKATYTGGSITGNSARIGGGISITKDSLETGSKIAGTEFADNSGAYYVNVLSTADINSYNACVSAVASWTTNGDIDAGSAYNNYDIGYPENNYTITYEANGGTESIIDVNRYGQGANATVLSGADITVPLYYHFIGWNTKADASGTSYKPGAEITVTADITLYAQWDRESHTVTFNATENGYFKTEAGEKVTLTYDVLHGETIESPEDPVAVADSKTPYFNGWWKDEAGNKFDFSAPITEDITLTAGWVAAQNDSIAVQLHSHGGTTQGVVFVKAGEMLSEAVDSDGNAYEDPTRTGYTFGGWYEKADFSSDQITGDTTITADMADEKNYLELHAKWNAVTYEAELLVGTGGSVTVEGAEKKDSNTYTYTYETEVTLTAEADKGYTFSHWQITTANPADSTGSITYTIQKPVLEYTHLTADAEVRAVFTKNAYTVTFYDEDGEQLNAISVNHGEQIAEKDYPSPDTDAKELKYWLTGDNEKWDTDAPVEEDLTLTAMMAARSYTVTFDPNGGNWSGLAAVKTVSAAYGETLSTDAVPKTPTYEGYKFRGWSTNADAYWEWDVTVPVFGAVTVYAYWDAIDVTVPGGSGEDGTHVFDPDELEDLNKDNGTVEIVAPDESGSGNAEGETEEQLSIHVLKADSFQLKTETVSDEDAWSYEWYLTDENGALNLRKLGDGDVLSYSFSDTGTYYVHAKISYTDATATGNQTGTTYSTVIKVVVWATAHEVRFKTAGGSAVSSQTVEYLEKIRIPENPARDGYAFRGWYADSAYKTKWNFATDVIGNSDMTLYAKWEAVPAGSYLIRYVVEGYEIYDQIVAAGESVQAPDDPYRSGCKFVGWYRDRSQTDAYEFGHAASEDITLYAGFEEIVHNVEFKTDTDEVTGSIKVPAQTVSDGELLSQPDDPYIEDPQSRLYFEGWYTDAQCTMRWDFAYEAVYADLTLYANWEEVPDGEHAVVFRSNGGTYVPTALVRDGHTVTRPDDPTRMGYTLEDWYLDETGAAFDFTTSIDTRKILTASWNANAYTVTFDSGDDSVYAERTATYGETFDAPNPPRRSGYIFTGWYLADGSSYDFEAVYQYTEDITLYAGWRAITDDDYIHISFYTNGGTPIEDQLLEPGEPVSKPADPDRTGYTFAGWYEDESLKTPFDFDQEMYEDAILYAKWTVNAYTVTFESNGGSKVSAQMVAYGDKVTAPSVPTRNGYDFSGWYRESDLRNSWNFEIDTMPDGDITLYAKWTLKSTDDGNGNGSVTDPKEKDEYIHGTGKPGATIEITWPDGSTSYTTVNKDGTWTIKVPDHITLEAGDVIRIRQYYEEDPEDESTRQVLSDYEVKVGKSATTGDNQSIFLWLLLLAASLICGAGLWYRRRRKNVANK